MSQQPTNDVLAEIEADLAAGEIEWQGEAAGDMVAGYLTAIEYKELASGRILPIIYLRARDGGTVKVAAGRKVLANELAGKRVQPGDAVGIQYEGTRTTDNGTEYHGYRVVVRPQGPRTPAEAFQADPKPDLGLVPDLGGGADDKPVW